MAADPQILTQWLLYLCYHYYCQSSFLLAHSLFRNCTFPVNFVILTKYQALELALTEYLNCQQRNSVFVIYKTLSKCYCLPSGLIMVKLTVFFVFSQHVHNAAAVCWCAQKGLSVGLTRQVVRRLEFVGDVPALKNLHNELLPLCLHLLLQRNFDLPHHLRFPCRGKTYICSF